MTKPVKTFHVDVIIEVLDYSWNVREESVRKSLEGLLVEDANGVYRSVIIRDGEVTLVEDSGQA